MNSNETKVLMALFGGIALLGGIFITADYISKKQKNELELKKAELEASYPPEYWVAQQAKAEADAKTAQAKIESDERLKVDERERMDAEQARKRAFEKDAPAEYWEQKRIEEEEKTKRDLNRQRYESEKAIAQQHSELIREGAKAADRIARYGSSYLSHSSTLL